MNVVLQIYNAIYSYLSDHIRVHELYSVRYIVNQVFKISTATARHKMEYQIVKTDAKSKDLVI